LFEELCAETVWEGGPRIESRILFDVLSTQPGIGVVVLDASNRVVYCNDEAARACLCSTPDAVRGCLVHDLFPHAVAAEICETTHHVRDDDLRIIRRTVWCGRPLQSVFQPLPVAQGEHQFVLVTTQIGWADCDQPRTELAETRHVCLGRLNILTRRELEVLALLGEGKRIKEIATILSRSPKTIESHKEGIGRKLNVTDRAKFIEIARTAGLDMDMVHRQRVEIECDGPDAQPDTPPDTQ
jgi:DNA-binding CsgD family transcriptional regulator